MQSGGEVREISRALTREIKRSYPGLAWVDFSGNKIEVIENLEPLSTVSGIDLSQNSLTCCDLNELAALPLLEKVDVSKNDISSVKPVASTKQAPPIEKVDLSYTLIRSVEYLDGLDSLSGTLRSLNLCGTPLSKSANYRVLVARRFPWLEILDGVPITRHVIDKQVSVTPFRITPPVVDDGGEIDGPSFDSINQEELLLAQLNAKIEELEAAKYELQAERESIERERILASEVLQNLAAARSKDALVSSQRKVPTTTTASQTKTEDSSTQISSQGTQASIGNGMETQTEIESRNNTTQTDPAIPRPSSWTRSVQTEIKAVHSQATQTNTLENSDTTEKQLERKDGVIAELEASLLCQGKLLNDLKARVATLQMEEQTWKEERRQTVSKLENKNVNAESRTAAMEKLLLAQEKAIIDAEGRKEQSKPEEFSLLRSLVEGWRRKTFQLLVLNESERLHAKSASRVAEKDRLALLDELENERKQTNKLMEINNERDREIRRLEHEITKIKNHSERIHTDRAGLKSLLAEYSSDFMANCDRLQSICGGVQGLSTTGKKLERQVVSVSKLVSRNRARQRASNQLLQSSTEEKERLANSLEEAEGRCLVLEQSFRQLESERGKLEAQIEQLRTDSIAQGNQLEQEKTACIAKAAELEREKIEILENKNSETEKLLRESRASIAQLERELLRTQARIENEDRARIEYLESRLQRRELEVHNIRRERNALLHTLRDAEKRGLLPGLGLAKRQNHLGEHEAQRKEDHEPSIMHLANELLRAEELDQSGLEQGSERLWDGSLSVENIDGGQDGVEGNDDEDDEVLEMLVLEAVRSRLSQQSKR